MASKNIKGITIELDGNTTGLEKALSGVEGEIKKSEKSLKEINKLLKLDPKNTVLLKQKHQELGNEIKSTKEKLETLKTAQEQAKQQGDLGKDKYEALEREIEATQIKLQGLVDDFAKTNAAAEKLKDIGGTMQEVGSKISDVGKDMTAKVTAPIVGIGAASVKTAADFDKSMSQVQATMGISKDAMSDLNGESVNTMDAMRNLAKEMGASTAFSASECADAINYLALAGYDVQQTYDTLPTVLNLAAAGGMDLASASDMVTDAMSALGLTSDTAGIMVDKMAKTASSSNTSVAQLGDALLTIGATGRSVAGGTTELTTALGILADNGIKGSEGGTKLRNVIMSLQNPTDKASDAMKDLGVQVYDAQGNMRPLNLILEDFNGAMDGMTDEKKSNIISTIFNKADIASVNALLANSGDRWDELSQAVDGAWYSTESMSQSLQTNVGKSLEEVCQSLEQFGISADDVAYCLDECGGDAYDFVDTLWEVSENAGSAEEILDAMGTNLEDVQTAFDSAAGSAQQMADTQLDNLDGQMTLLKSAVEGASISIGEKLMPYISKLVEWINKAVDWFNGLSDTQLNLIITIAAVIAAIGPLLLIIGGVVSAIGTVCTVVGTLMTAWTAISGAIAAGTPILAALAGVFGAVNIAVVAVIAVIAAVIAIIVICIKHWDQIKATVTAVANAIKTTVVNAFNTVKTTVSTAIEAAKNAIKTGLEAAKGFVTEKLDAIKRKFTEIFDSVKSKVTSVIDGIKGLFSGLKLELPKFKLPHFKVTGSLSLSPPSVPKLSVEWYRKAMDRAMVLDTPTIFGASSSGLLAGGEAGREVVAGEAHLMDLIGKTVNATMAAYQLPVVSELRTMNKNLPGAMSNAVAGMKVQVGDRNVGRVVRDVR